MQNGLALFVSMTLAALFVFFALVALQGLLLNVISPRLFPGVSLFVQCTLFTVLVCVLPFVLSIPGLDRYMHLRPDFARWLPPVWFLGLDQQMLGNREPLRARLARLALAAAAGAGLLRRGRVPVELSPAESAACWKRPSRRATNSLCCAAGRNKWSDRFLPDQPEHAVFSFTMATLARSRAASHGAHRLRGAWPSR